VRPSVPENGAYRSDKIPACGTWEQAHNTALEIASEISVAFTISVVAGSLAILFVWIGVLAIARSQVDFPLQVPDFRSRYSL
jgi:hypothetical protein